MNSAVRVLPFKRLWAGGTGIKILFLLVTPLLLYVMLLPVMPLMEPDEARYSDIASSMNRSGDYVTPRLNHVVYLEKPPLAYWATAFFFRVFGENEFSSRLFSALSAWGCILLVYSMGHFLYNEKTALYGAGVLGTFLYMFILGRFNILDIPLTFFVSLAIWGGHRFFAENTRRKQWITLFYCSSSLAFLTKGLIGFIFPPAIVGIWLIAQKRWRDIFRLFYLPGIALSLAIVSPWIILVQKANKEFLSYFFIEQHFLRYTMDTHGGGNVFYYLPFLILGTVPWLAFLIEVFRESKGKRAFILKAGAHRFLLIWIGFVIVFFSLSSSKLMPYIAPAFLPIALLLGHVFKGYEEEKVDQKGKGALRSHPRLPVVVQSSIILVLLLLVPFSGRHAVLGRTWWPLVVVPILSLGLTAFLPEYVYEKWRRAWFLTIYLASVMFLGSIVFPASHYFTPYKTSFPVAQAVKEFLPSNEELYQYRIFLRGINFYCKIRTPIVGRADELQSKKESLPLDEKTRYFLSKDEFYEICKRRGNLYSITQGNDKYDELQRNIPHVRVIWTNREYFLLHLMMADPPTLPP
jgi:4-amino-4-deoxy-L-arabinose transferase-like glycosyltransferase